MLVIYRNSFWIKTGAYNLPESINDKNDNSDNKNSNGNSN